MSNTAVTDEGRDVPDFHADSGQGVVISRYLRIIDDLINIKYRQNKY